MHSTKVICVSGKAQHGKDTVAGLLDIALTEKDRKSIVIHYADLLKFICSTYFKWDGKKDDKGRTLLQHVGTDVVRKQEPNFWVDFVSKLLHLFDGEWDYVIIPDCRFPNEIDTMKNNFCAWHLRVERPNFDNGLSVEQQNHISETSLDDYPYDYKINNYSGLHNLTEQINNFIHNELGEHNDF
jgi:hypothetical protein